MIDRGKWSNTLHETKPFKNKNKNPPGFQGASYVKKEAKSSNKIQDHAWVTEVFQVKRK